MDFFNSFFQNVKDKLTSPFFGTLSFILIFHHWEFWYTLFNFDKDCTRTEKLAILRLLAAKEFTFLDLLSDVGFAALFVLIGYGVVFCTRALSLAFDHKAMTWLTRKVVSKNVVLLETHKNVVKERDEYAEQYEEQRQRVRLFSKNLDEQTKQIEEKDSFILSEGGKLNDLNKNLTRVQADLNRIQLERDEFSTRADSIDKELEKVNTENEKIKDYVGRMEKDLFAFRKMILTPSQKIRWTSPANMPADVINKAIELQDNGVWKDFIQVALALENGGTYSADQLNLLMPFNVITPGDEIRLTPVGNVILYYRELFLSQDWRDRAR
jgi:hypothetical protein